VREAIAKDTRGRAEYAEVHEVRERIALLTARERDVFRYVITGMLNKQIAHELGIAEKTVKVHRGRIMEKLGADSVADLVRLAEKAGITPPTDN
jgi:FixJ family two-component response regulator